jgi:hypothetical protein
LKERRACSLGAAGLRAVCGVALSLVAAGGLGAPEAGGRVRALAVGEVAAGPVLAGDRVLWGEQDGSDFRLRSVPLTGGRPVTVFRHGVEGPDPGWRALDASASRAAFALDPGSAFAGRPGGPFAKLAERAVTVDVAGDAVVTAEANRVLVHRPGLPVAPLAPPAEADPGGVAAEGDHVAYPVRREGRDEVVVTDLTSGAERYRILAAAFDLQADGKLATLTGAALAWASPAEPRPHRIRLGRRVDDVRIAANRLVVRARGPQVPTGGTGVSADHLKLVDLRGRSKPVTPRTVSLRGLDYDGRALAWSANGCILVSDLRGPSPAAVPPGPCFRAEVIVEDVDPPRLSPRRRTIQASLTCVSAPGGRCRGEVRLQIGEARATLDRSPYRLDAGQRGSVRLSVPVRWLPRLERPTAVRIEARTRDPQGRISVAGGTTVLSARPG